MCQEIIKEVRDVDKKMGNYGRRNKGKYLMRVHFFKKIAQRNK